MTSFFPGLFKMTVTDENAGTIHTLENRRFNYQARDSPVDLLARDKWKSEWHDKFTGNLYLTCPRGVPGVPRELTRVTVTCSWASAFCVVEYCLGDTFYQFSCRPPRGTNRWSRRNLSRFETTIHHAPTENEPSSSSQAPPEPYVPLDPPPPIEASPSLIGGE